MQIFAFSRCPDKGRISCEYDEDEYSIRERICKWRRGSAWSEETQRKVNVLVIDLMSEDEDPGDLQLKYTSKGAPLRAYQSGGNSKFLVHKAQTTTEVKKSSWNWELKILRVGEAGQYLIALFMREKTTNWEAEYGGKILGFQAESQGDQEFRRRPTSTWWSSKEHELAGVYVEFEFGNSCPYCTRLPAAHGFLGVSLLGWQYCCRQALLVQLRLDVSWLDGLSHVDELEPFARTFRLHVRKRKKLREQWTSFVSRPSHSSLWANTM